MIPWPHAIFAAQLETKMIRRSLPLIALLALSLGAHAQSKTFKVGGMDARQLATIENDTDFETFTGRTHKVAGSLTFDPSKKTGGGTLTVDLNTVETGIALRDEHMRSPGWLDTAKFPEAKLVTTKVKSVGKDEFEVTGLLTLHGVTKEVKTKAKVRYMAASSLTASKGFKGDVLHVAAKLPIKLSDYGIMVPDMAKGKVSNEVTLTISAFATTE